jgi:Phage terminase, small subunit
LGAKVEPVPPGPVHAAKAKAARGYRWETASPQNYLGLKTPGGPYASRITARLTDELVAEMLELRPDLATEWARPVLRCWCQAYALSQQFALALDAGGPFKTDGEPRASYLKEWRAAVRTMNELGKELGLSPASYARLAQEQAAAISSSASVEALASRGRAAIEATAVDGEESA